MSEESDLLRVLMAIWDATMDKPAFPPEYDVEETIALMESDGSIGKVCVAMLDKLVEFKVITLH